MPKLRAFMVEVGRRSQGPGRVYLVGGATALLLGVRESTIDIDLKLDPEPKAIFEGLAKLKEQLSINIELASPDLFLPTLPGWKDRSEFIERCGDVEFFHYDFYAQALAKLLRGYTTDLRDVRSYIDQGKITPERLWGHFLAIRSDLVRYPAVDAEAFEFVVREFVRAETHE